MALASRLCRSSSTIAGRSVLCFNGDGVGPEIVSAAKEVVAASGVNINWVNMDMGFEAQERTGHVVTEEHLKAFEEHKVLFKGPLTIPPKAKSYVEIRDRKFTSANQVFRKVFDLYANIRPAKSMEGVATPFSGVDLVVVRENTQCLYTGEERWVDADTVEGIRRITRGATQRIAEDAFEYARKHGRKRVTAVHKANVCKQADGLFLGVCGEVAQQYPDIAFDDHLADSLCTRLVQAPQEFDVLLCPNLFGDIVSDLAAGLIGSLGLMPSGQFGDGMAVFEPAHGSAPDIAGQGIVNPLSQVRCAEMLLEYLGEHAAAARIEAAVREVVAAGDAVTKDLGGHASTAEMTSAIVATLQK